ncbi:MAG: chitosanase [Methylococcales bacterium]|nr:chitosanase [Methylococcales bacterium]
MKKKLIVIGLLMTVLGCGNNPNSISDSTPENKKNDIKGKSTENNDSGLLVENIFDQERRTIADQVISVFENDNPVIQYDFIENLHDGRGYTAGRAGFTSATADMLEVIERYSAVVPKNGLVAYIPRLKELAKTEGSSVIGLEGLEKNWKKAAKDSAFRKIQDNVVDDYYFNSAIKYAKQLGISLPITLLNLYDAAIQHGDGVDADSLSAIIQRASSKVGGSPKTGVDEMRWVQAFMNDRKSTLLNPANKETQNEWAESVGRVDALIRLYQSGNVMLKAPVKINPWGGAFSLPVR